MKKKLLILTLALIAVFCVLVISVNAQEIDYSEKATLLDGTVLPIYDQDNNPLIWFIKDASATGMDKYASVPNNRNTADNATSYVTYNINSTYGKNQLHDVNIKYWDAEAGAYVSYGEGTVVVYNLRGVDTLWCVGTYASSENLEYVYMPSSCRDVGTYNGYSKLQLVDFSLATDYEGFGKQAFRNCTALREVRFGTSEVGYELKSAQYGCLFQSCTSLTTLRFTDISKITAIEGGAFENCHALTGTYDFSGVTSVGSKAFYKAGTNEGTSLVFKFPNLVTLGGSSGDTHVFSYSGVKELYFGNKITTMSHNTFSNCTRLEIVEFTGVTEDFEFKSYTFEGCTALKAFSIPDGVTELPQRMFRNCTSLGAVYIPSSVTAINSGDNDHATFKGCESLYFVSTPFTHENIPEEPTVYYFPSGLTTITGETFDSARINDVVVLPTGVTSLTQGYTFEGTTSKSGKPTVVFMGNMEAVTVKNWGAGKILFANENDIDASSAGYTGSVSAIYCNAQGNTEHLIEKTMSTEADCVNPQMTANYCFCGSIVGEAETVGDALGHDLTGNSYYVFESLTVAGKTCVDCGRCDHVEEIAHESAIVVAMGYSVKTYGTDKTFATGYFVDKEMLKNYENAKGVSVSFGFGFNAADTFNYDGTLNSFAIVAPILNVGTSEKDFSAFTYRMIYASDDHIDDLIVIAAYVIEADENGESLSFLNAVDGELETASYNSILEKVNNQ
ncbi:MAG: leucine-rich repeat protein [Clostridia bacterium]|nr:leucine-rich repeat protein [Clostridia bacterium]